MRVSSTVDRLDVVPGGSGVVPLEVVNTSEVIESLSVHALGVPEASLLAEPEALALFPDAVGALTLTVGLPATFPAGTYPVTFVVAGRAPGGREAYHDVDLVVPARPALRLDATPTIVRTRGRGAFTLEVRNDGNVPLDVALRPQDGDRTVRTTITPSTLAVPPGGGGAASASVEHAQRRHGLRSEPAAQGAVDRRRAERDEEARRQAGHGLERAQTIGTALGAGREKTSRRRRRARGTQAEDGVGPTEEEAVKRSSITLFVVAVALAGCPERRTPTRTTHGTGSAAPARVDPPKPTHRHSSHEHGHGAHPHQRDAHHHHLHPHPHLDGVKGHHHPY